MPINLRRKDTANGLKQTKLFDIIGYVKPEIPKEQQTKVFGDIIPVKEESKERIVSGKDMQWAVMTAVSTAKYLSDQKGVKTIKFHGRDFEV